MGEEGMAIPWLLSFCWEGASLSFENQGILDAPIQKPRSRLHMERIRFGIAPGSGNRRQNVLEFGFRTFSSKGRTKRFERLSRFSKKNQGQRLKEKGVLCYR